MAHRGQQPLALELAAAPQLDDDGHAPRTGNYCYCRVLFAMEALAHTDTVTSAVVALRCASSHGLEVACLSDFFVSALFLVRQRMDVRRPHHHGRDRLRRAGALVERGAARLGRRPRRDALLRLRHLRLGVPAVPLLHVPRVGEEAEELHLHGCRQDAPGLAPLIDQVLECFFQKTASLLVCGSQLTSKHFPGKKHTWLCGSLQYLNLYGTAVAYTITTATCIG
jgi:hypothetical protein